MYYADHGFLRSISRKRLTSLIFKVSGRPLGGVSAMALNNILATATHTAAQKQYGGGSRPPNSLRYRTSRTSKQQQKTRQLHKKERKPEAVQKKKTQRRWQDKLWPFTWELGKPQGDQAPTSGGGNQWDGQCHDQHISQTGQTRRRKSRLVWRNAILSS